MNQTNSPNGRLPELESLRGLASWWVVVGHVAYTFSDRLGHIINNRSAVDLFFILSGFVIFALMDRKPEPYGVFITRRFFRIFPAFIFVVVLSALLLPMQISALADSPHVTARAISRIASLQAIGEHLPAHLALHTLMLHGLAPTNLLPFSDIAIVGQGWSIGVEWVFYLLAPFFLRVGRGGPPGWIAALAMVAGLWLLGRTPGLRENSAFVGTAAPWLALGAVSYFWRKVMVAGAMQWLWPTVGLGVIAAVLLKSPGLLIWVAVWPIIVGHQGLVANLPRRILNSRLLIWLGKTSYSTYLIHMLAMYASMIVATKLHLNFTGYAAVVSVGTVAVTALACAVMHDRIELPLMEQGARLAARMRRSAPASV